MAGPPHVMRQRSMRKSPPSAYVTALGYPTSSPIRHSVIPATREVHRVRRSTCRVPTKTTSPPPLDEEGAPASLTAAAVAAPEDESGDGAGATAVTGALPRTVGFANGEAAVEAATSDARARSASASESTRRGVSRVSSDVSRCSPGSRRSVSPARARETARSSASGVGGTMATRRR